MMVFMVLPCYFLAKEYDKCAICLKKRWYKMLQANQRRYTVWLGVNYKVMGKGMPEDLRRENKKGPKIAAKFY